MLSTNYNESHVVLEVIMIKVSGGFKAG